MCWSSCRCSGVPLSGALHPWSARNLCRVIALPTHLTPTDENREAVDPQGGPPARAGGRFAYPGHPAGARPVLDDGGCVSAHTTSLAPVPHFRLRAANTTQRAMPGHKHPDKREAQQPNRTACCAWRGWEGREGAVQDVVADAGRVRRGMASAISRLPAPHDTSMRGRSGSARCEDQHQPHNAELSAHRSAP